MGWIKCTCAASRRRRRRRACRPIIATKVNKTKIITAKVVPSRGVETYTVEVVEEMLEQVGYRRVILRSDSEPVILALKEAVRRERERERQRKRGGDSMRASSCG